jgi:uncharacterized membrane protein HdeD (DUF308 family)
MGKGWHRYKDNVYQLIEIQMFTFGYKSRFNGPVRALVALAIGVVMVIYPAGALVTIVKIVAAFMLASGIVSLLLGLKDRAKGSLPLMSFNAIVDVLLGLLMFVFPGVIARFMIYLVGFGLLIFGLMQIFALLGARRYIALGLGAFLLPAVVTLVGGFILFNPFAESVMVIIAGSALVVYGASELFSSWKMKKAIDEYEIHQAPVQEQPSESETYVSDIKDVEYEKVDEQ